jgi:deoxyribose-phosphate aldolase
VLAALDLDADTGIHVATVCVHHPFIGTAREALRGSEVAVCAVSAGFPTGLSPMATRLAEIHASREAGASEIDVVITRGHVLTGAWQALYDEVAALREACGAALMKVILGTGDLGPLSNVGRAALVAMMAGADFVKTSTGKERENATLPVGLVMARAIRGYHERTGFAVGLKPAGGIGKAHEALAWLTLVKEELGDAWLGPARFRLGASGLLADLARRLESGTTPPGGAVRRRPCSGAHVAEEGS